MKPNIVFMGSPEFALPTLQTLTEHYAIVGVVTQPDRPAGRGRKVRPPAIKLLAQELGLPFIQPRRVREEAALAQIQAWQPDLIVVAAFGQILRPVLLELPAYGCVNVHASLLPRWRGAAPIQAAILHGDQHSGVTIMRMDAGMDTGPILYQKSVPLLPQDTAASLSERLSKIGAQALIEALPSYLAGELIPQPQDEAFVTMAPMLSKSDGQLDSNRSALELERQVRAFNPWPGSFIIWKNQPLKILQATHITAQAAQTPATRAIHQNFPAIHTKQGLLVLEQVQPAGKKILSGDVFLRGAKDWETK